MQSCHSEQKKEEIRNAADIVQVIGEHVQLKRAGTNFTGLCPFHSEKTPSFTVFPQTQSFHCFGCGESGDVFAFLMKQQHLSFPEAMRELAARYSVELPSPQLTAADHRLALLHQINAEAARLYGETYSQNAEFYAFQKSLESYQNILRRNSSLVLSPKADLFRYLESPAGQ